MFVGSGYPDFNQMFQHMINELSSATFLKVGERKIELDFQPILFVADLIGKAKVLKMKQCNGFYGCTLCTQRGFHFAGSHRYPHDEKFVMRSHESHLLNLRELEKGSIREIQLKHGRKADAEVRTQGVKGRSILLSLIPNQPLSSPIDPMHQLFLGVAKDLLGYLYDKMRVEHRGQLNTFLGSVALPKELENTVRRLEALSNMKAKELKTILLYLSPVILPSFLFGEDKRSDEDDLKKLVFAIRELYDSSKNAELCETLIDEFCLSMAEKCSRMESINFHLLRHLSWQVRSIGPLFTTSAFMFESANRLLLAPLTGTVNHCHVLVQRFIRSKLLATIEVQDDCLTQSLNELSTKKPFDEAFGMVETEATRNFRREHPRKRLFCRIRDSFFLTSGAYGRGSRADIFVAISLNEDILLGEILFFYEDETKKCVLRKKHIISKIKLVRGASSESSTFGFVVSDSEETVEVPVAMIAYKLFHFVFKEKNYLVKIMRHFEHN